MDVKNGSHCATSSESSKWRWSISASSTIEDHVSNDDGTAIEIISGPIFGFDDLDVNEIEQHAHSDEFLMIFDEEEESSGLQHSPSKPKRRRSWQLQERNLFLYNPKSTKSWPQSPSTNGNTLMLLDLSPWLKELNGWKPENDWFQSK